MAEIPEDVMKTAKAAHAEFADSRCKDNLGIIIAERERCAKQAEMDSLIADMRRRVKARSLSDEEITDEMAAMEMEFNERPDCGGSPGEWAFERMNELETEINRRKRGARAAAIRRGDAP